MRQYIFIAGMPRSGSTLLPNILGQNPQFRVGSTSGIMDVMFGVRNQWDQLIEFRASPNSNGKKRVLKGILDSYYSDTEQPVVFDKCRGWIATGMLEMFEEVYQTKAKIIVPVRDLREILSSFEKLHRGNALVQSALERENYFAFQTVQGRTSVWMQGNQPVGLAYNRITDAIQRGVADRLHFVDFHDLTHDPRKTFYKIHDFIEEEYYQYDFYNVEQLTVEDDTIHGVAGLHKIRRKVEPLASDYHEVLGSAADQWKGPYVWEKYIK